MSNQTVGAVYQQVIREVVESSRVDFEEGGVDESVLDELSRLWQQKLSQLNVATFPWDPKPEPAAPATTLASIPPMQQSLSYPQQTHTPPMQQSIDAHQVHQQQQYMQHAPSQPQAPPALHMPQIPSAGVRIKTEPGLESTGPAPVYAGLPNVSTAQQRAAQNLQASYGARAAASINAIHHGMPQVGQQQQHGQPQRPPSQGIPRPPMSQSQYTHAMAQQTAQQRQQMQAQSQAQGQGQNPSQQGQNGAQHSQTDGADDAEDRHAHFGVVKQIASDGAEVSMGRVEIDGMIRRQIEARGKAMEGGGLMLPLKQHRPSTLGRDRKRKAPGQESAGQHDGADEDDDDDVKPEDEDEDAINSALDDSDEPRSDDSGDEETPQVMLCMYDKVQRVKNKWKCVMKDGVLTINGKDYVFHKASGEYEW